MAMLSKDELRTLIEQSEGPCVSIFLPVQRAGTETRQNPIRLKNLLAEAEERLVASGLRSTEAQDLLQPAHALADEGLFWQHRSDGLALFCAPDFFRSYQLPLDFEELVVVDDRFHIKPLLSFFTNNERFYILALSQNAVRLLQATRHSVSEIELERVPKNIDEALQYDDPEKETQFFTGMPGANVPGGGAGGGDRPAVVFGTGAAAFENNDLLRYCHRVDKGLYEEALHDEQAPLVLAGVEHLLPIYHQASSYRNLLDAGVTGNPDMLRPEELHTQAWAVVEPYFQQAQQAAAERYGQALAHNLAAKDVREIVPAAYYGRIDTLFVAVDQQQWGSFDPDTGTVHLHPQAEPADQDLLDLAAVHTFLNSGTIYAVAPDMIPDDAPAVAIYRY